MAMMTRSAMSARQIITSTSENADLLDSMDGWMGMYLHIEIWNIFFDSAGDVPSRSLHFGIKPSEARGKVLRSEPWNQFCSRKRSAIGQKVRPTGVEPI